MATVRDNRISRVEARNLFTYLQRGPYRSSRNDARKVDNEAKNISAPVGRFNRVLDDSRVIEVFQQCLLWSLIDTYRDR